MIDLFKEIGKLGCKPIDTHIEPNHKLGEVLEDQGWDCRSCHVPTIRGRTHLLSTY